MTNTPEMPDADHPTVSFRPVEDEEGKTPPNPVDAASHAQYAFTNSSERPGDLLQTIVGNDKRAADAAQIGWIIYFPETIVISNNQANSDGDEPKSMSKPESDVVSQSDPNERIYCVDLQWDVSLPAGTQLLAFPPFNHRPHDDAQVIPSVVASSFVEESGFSRVEIYMLIESDVKFTNQMPAAQLVLTDQVPEAVQSRPLTSDELQEQNRHDRASSLYSDWYEQVRDDDRH